MSNEQILVEKIKKASEAYYTTGKSDLSDREFDLLVEELEKINPNSEILNKREIHSNDWNYELEELPIKLYSIKKVKTWNEIKNWIDFIGSKLKIDTKYLELILTPKYDGIKLLYNNGNFYTRYETGEQGYNVTNRIKDTINILSSPSTEGELIISKSNFQKYCKGYTSSRNFIPAIFSSKERLENQDKVDYIRYSLYNQNGKSKEEQINICNRINKVKVPYLKIYYKDLTEDKIIKFYFDNLFDFEYDGVVIDINNYDFRLKLGETQKYLDCCRAYKGDALFDDIKESKIEDIIWQMSRYGKLTPVAKITPVVINEGVVSNVSLYNAAYIKENNIFIGQKIKVTRKGKINPKIVEFIDKKDITILPIFCPFCGEKLKWNETNIDLICENDNCLEKKIQQIYFFLKIIGVKDFGIESVRSYVKVGFDLEDFFDEMKVFNANIEGIGNIVKYNFNSEIKRIITEGIELEKLQEASGLFQGMSQSTLKILNTLNVDMNFYFNDEYYNEIYKKGLELEGIGQLTINDYLNGLYNFYTKGFWDKIKKYIPLKVKQEKLEDQRFLNKNICFTGFRNKDWEEIVNNNGGKVLSSVTSNCNLLVVKDINSVSSKMQKAKQMGIEILSVEDFSKLF